MRRAVVTAAVLLGAHAAHADELCRKGAVHHGKALDLDVKDADVHDVMRLLGDVGNVNIVVSDEVRAKVTLRLKRVAWDQVACTIGALYHLRIRVNDNIVLVTPAAR